MRLTPIGGGPDKTAASTILEEAEMGAKTIIQAKLLSMDSHLKFLEFAWTSLSQFERDKIINNYEGEIPRKYKR